jgi:hypothetical protein
MICDVTDRRVDGCYGWIVVLSGFCLIVLTDGILFTFGNLLIELTEYFDADRARIALIGALTLGFSCLTGKFFFLTFSACFFFYSFFF